MLNIIPAHIDNTQHIELNNNFTHMCTHWGMYSHNYDVLQSCRPTVLWWDTYLLVVQSVNFRHCTLNIMPVSSAPLEWQPLAEFRQLNGICNLLQHIHCSTYILMKTKRVHKQQKREFLFCDWTTKSTTKHNQTIREWTINMCRMQHSSDKNRNSDKLEG